MGFIRQAAAKLTGADIQADAMERGANEQAAATRAAADAAARNSQEAAAQAARLQESAAARNVATSAASEQLNKPLENAEVSLDGKPSESAIGAARKRRQSFGVGQKNIGVNI